LGTGWNGARAFTATSGPGISLMQEFLGLAYFSEIPLVLFSIQRAGPSTGMPTRTQQSDILSCAFASHGDTKHVMLFPSTPKECFDFAAGSFDIADRLQTPIIVMSDLELGMNKQFCDSLAWDDAHAYDRGEILTAVQLEGIEKFGRYDDIDDDGIGYRTYPGTHPTLGSYFTRGSSHDEFAAYTEDGDIYARVMDRINRKFKTAVKYLPKPEIKKQAKEARKHSKLGLIFYGSTATADIGSRTKSGEESLYDEIDMAVLAIELGASFVARSFSGDKSQLVPLIQAGFSHKGFAFIDVISPCVKFNNTDLSTHGYKNTWENYEALSSIDYVPMKEEISTSYAQGEDKEITLHDGSVIHLHKTSNNYEPNDKENAIHHINAFKKHGKIATGLLYINQDVSDLHELIDTVNKPFNSLNTHDLCP